MAATARDIQQLHTRGRDAGNIMQGLQAPGSDALADWRAFNGGFGAAAGGFRTGAGIYEMAYGDPLQGARDTSGGLGWMGSGAGNLCRAWGDDALGSTLGRYGGGFSAVSGGLQAYQGYDQFMTGQTTQQQGRGLNNMLRGGVATGAGVATAMGASVSPHAAAFALGSAIGDFGDSESQRRGMFGFDEASGRNRSASDWAGDVGASAGGWVQGATGSNFLGSAAMYGTTVAASVPAALGAFGNTVVGGAERLGSWISSWF